MNTRRVFLSGVLFFVGFSVISQDQYVSDSLQSFLFARGDDISDSLRHRHLRSIVQNETRPEVALPYALELLELSKGTNDDLNIAVAFSELNMIYRVLGDIEKATEALLASRKIFERIGLQDQLAASYAQEASILMLEGLYEQSITSYRQSLYLYKELSDTLSKNLVRLNLGEAFRLHGKFDSSAVHLRQALRENYTADEIVEGYGTGNLGMVYRALGRHDSARLLLAKSISILEPMGDVYSVAVYDFELGLVLATSGERKRGEERMLGAYKVAIAEGLKEQLRDFSRDFAMYFADKGDFEQALGYQRRYELYKDSLINIENVRKVEQLRGQHALERSEAEIDFLNQLNRSQQHTLLAVASGAVGLLVLLGLLYRNNQQKKKANIALSQREKEKALLLQELNHRTKNNLQMISSLLNLQSNELGDDTAAEAVRQGRYRVDSLAMIHQKLYQEDYSSIHMQQYLQDLLEHLKDSFDPQVNLQTDIIAEHMKVDKAIPIALIVNEMVTNALNYGKPAEGESMVFVGLSHEASDYQLLVKDNGPGMEQPVLDDLPSFGLKLIYALTDQLDGEINFDNKEGTEWRVNFSD